MWMSYIEVLAMRNESCYFSRSVRCQHFQGAPYESVVAYLAEESRVYEIKGSNSVLHSSNDAVLEYEECRFAVSSGQSD